MSVTWRNEMEGPMIAGLLFVAVTGLVSILYATLKRRRKPS